MKWPIVERFKDGSNNIIKVEYYTRVTELILDTEKCTICQQCIRACPKNALELPKIPKGVRVPRKERVPILSNVIMCKFCGVCMAMCPYEAISMKLDGQPIAIEDLKLIKETILPMVKHIKVRQFELIEPNFTNIFWEKLNNRISIKKTIKTSE